MDITSRPGSCRWSRPPRRSGHAGAALLALLAAAVPGCRGCQELGDEGRVRSLVEEGAELAEKHAVGDLVDLTAEGFTAEPDGVGRDSLSGVLLMAFQHYGKLKVLHPRPDVSVDGSGERATAALPFLIVRENTPDLGLAALYDDPEGWMEKAGSIADLFHLELSLVKQDGDWLIFHARLEGGDWQAGM